MPAARSSTLLFLLLAALLTPRPADAQERACYRLTKVNTAGTHDSGDPMAVSDWEQLWTVRLLASLDLRHVAVSAPPLEVTLHADLQSATVGRTDLQGTPGPEGRYAWSRPPEVWCSDGPAALVLVLDGEGERLGLATIPGAAVVVDGITRVDGEILSMAVEAPGLRTAVTSVAPRVDGPPEFTLVALVAPDRARPELVLPVQHHYIRLDTSVGLASGAPIPPPAIVDSGRPLAGPDSDVDPDQKPLPSDYPEDDGDRKSYLGDASSGWFHLGGGGALIRPGTGAFTGGGRFALGFGGYTFFFYGGAGFEMDWSPVVPFKVHGVGYLGVHIPIPVVHPLIGVKVAGGMATDPVQGRVGPSLGIGGQAGVMLRAFDGRGGLRFMVEPTFGLTGMGDDESTFELWFVLAAVF